MPSRPLLSALSALAALLGAAGADVVLENPRLRAVLGEDAAWRSIVDKATGKDYCAQPGKLRFAAARVAEKTCEANAASLAGDQLTVAFAGTDTRLTYAVTTAPDWIAFRLVGVAGARPSHLTLVRLGVTITKNVGPRLSAGWDDDFAICLTTLNLQTQCGAGRRSGYAELAATTQDEPGPKLEGAGAALIAAPTPQLRPILHRLAVACDLPRNDADGTPAKDLPIARQSYWFIGFGEKEADKVIDYCRQTGFRQVMMGSGSWCRTVGHYTFNTHAYPDGLESLRRTIARLHGAGILVGMHCFASKISKTDAYVTPVPDRRFWVDKSADLAADVGPSDAAIRTAADLSQWPGSPVCKQKLWEGGVAKHQDVILDDEIIRYKTIGPEGKWDTFLGCERGAYGTRPAAHKAGTLCRHYGVDGCINGYIVDQETTLLEETTTRLAEIFNTCGFDMVYFDGGEDVDRRRFTYYVSKFQATAMSKFRKRPLIHMGTIMTHNLWHSFTRSATVDVYLSTIYGHLQAGGELGKWPTVKDHIDRSVRYMLSIREDMMPGELGWFGIWAKGKNTDGLQLDEIEYLMGKSLAYDAPISLETGFSQMESHPLTPGILEIVRAYEDLRTAGRLAEPAASCLRQPGRDFALVQDGRHREFVEVAAVPEVSGTHDIRAFVGDGTRGAVATLWHYTGKDGKLLLATEPSEVQATDVFGKPLRIEKEEGKAKIAFGGRRTTLLLKGRTAKDVQGLLASATVDVRKPVCLWLQAEDFRQRTGAMAKASEAGVNEPDALGDAVLCTGPIDRATFKDWCEYEVQLPHKGRWTLWARVRCLSGGDESFGITLPGEKVTLQGKQVLGNCGRNERKWHWTGQGGGTSSPPPGQPITFNLPRGRFVFRIYPREGGGTAALNPRLDAFCLTDDPAFAPTDADAAPALGRR